MFCYKCGAQLEDRSIFCHKCGAKVLIEDVHQEVLISNNNMQKREESLLSEKLHQSDIAMNEQNTELASAPEDNENFKEAVVPNGETEKKTDYAAQQALDNRTIPDVKSYGDSIKPYYCEQFDRIAHGEKAKFNWAAFFLNGWMQLYNGCTNVFCKTFLPWLLAYFIVSLVSIFNVMNFSMILMGITSVLGLLLGIGGFVLSIVNGFKFNEWFYQDVINNPGKKRSRKGLWFLIVAEIVMIVILQLTGRLVAKHVIDSFGDYYDESDDDLDSNLNEDFYEDSYGDLDEDFLDDANEDLLVEHSEDLVSIQGEDIEDSMKDVAQYEGAAREIIMEWFSRHPLQHNFRIEFMNETTNTEDGSGIYLNYEMYWGDDEWYGTFHVNLDTGDMVMDSMIMATGPTIVQKSMDQWYLEDYWFLGEDMGGYFEDYGNGIYGMYNSNETLVLEYSAERDAYVICDYDGQCFIEYDDGSETSEIDISDFAGTYAYDGSLEADDKEINFYYLLEIGEWDGYSFSIAETWRGNMLIQDEYARAKSLIVDTLAFDIYNPNVGYETHSLTYVPANESALGKDVIYLDCDNTMPYVRE